MTPQVRSPQTDRIALALRVFVYVFLVIAGMTIFPIVLYWVAPVPFVVSTLSSFAAAAVANAVALRIWEHGQLADIGMQWTRASRWNLLLGIAGGVAAGLFAVLAACGGPPVLAGTSARRVRPMAVAGFCYRPLVVRRSR